MFRSKRRQKDTSEKMLAIYLINLNADWNIHLSDFPDDLKLLVSLQADIRRNLGLDHRTGSAILTSFEANN